MLTFNKLHIENNIKPTILLSLIKIYIVDDHKVFRDGVASLIKYEEDMEVIGSAGTVPDFMNEIESVNPDVILMDISIGDDDGTIATKWIKEKNPQAKVLILSMHHEDKYIKKVLEAGANGYLLKDAGTKEMMQAIRAIANGNSFYSQKISDAMVQQLLKGNEPKEKIKTKKLTPRELEILKLIAEEKSNQEIADSLFISIRTVDTHRRNLLEKLQVKNSVGLVRYAIQQGIVEL